MNNGIVQLDDFFDFKSKEPINRLAFTKEDSDYKIKIIRKMQELGMKVTIDNIGNICGSISKGNNPNKTIAIGSHTDSVYNGGQYDGPVGVIVGLQTVENLLKRGFNGTIRVAIYACEESSRFGNACLGSKYLSGNIKEGNFDEILDQKAKQNGEKITLRQAVEEAKSYIHTQVNDLQEVNKIFEQVDYSLEAHIEQYELLSKKSKNLFFFEKDVIGIITSIGSAVRAKYSVNGQADHTGSTPMKKRKNAVDATAIVGERIAKLGRNFEKKGLGRASQIEINTPGHNGSFNQTAEKAEGLIDFRLLGENTPEKVLKEFSKIIKTAQRKTRTKITPEIVSKGTPVITSPSLNSHIEMVCKRQNIEYEKMPSYAGQDTGYVPAKEKTMIFIPSTGGSHNPKESTKKRFIERATNIFTSVTREILVERLKDRVAVTPTNQNNNVRTYKSRGPINRNGVTTSKKGER